MAEQKPPTTPPAGRTAPTGDELASRIDSLAVRLEEGTTAVADAVRVLDAAIQEIAGIAKELQAKRADGGETPPPPPPPPPPPA